MNQRRKDYGTRLQYWCRYSALPFWAEQAKDEARGGYHEQLFMDGEPDGDHTRRVRVQARHAYVYAHAHVLGWHDNAREASDHAWDYVLGPGSAGKPFDSNAYQGCAHLIAADGSLIDAMRDTYAQAFVILAGAWRYRAFDDKKSLRIAYETLAFLDRYASAQNGGWLETVPRALSEDLPRRQNPHMHLFEALMALYDVTDDASVLERATEIFDLFKTHFYDRHTGRVIEFFDADWKRENGYGGPVEPGHMMEWCWLLRAYEDRTDEDVDVMANALFTTAERLGLNEDLGLLCDSVDTRTGIKSNGHRTWPQTEYLKASLAQHRAGQMGMRSRANGIIEAMFTHYFKPGPDGGWIDSVDASGAVIVPVMPTSTFYHIMCAAAETVSAPLPQGWKSEAPYMRPIEL